MGKQANLDSADQDIHSATQSLIKIKARTDFFKHSLKIPITCFLITVIILFILFYRYDIASPKYILISSIGVFTTYLSLRTFLTNFNKSLSQELEILESETKKEGIYLDFRSPHSSLMSEEVDKLGFVIVAIGMLEDYKNKLTYSCTLSIFPAVIGLINYIASL